jgi:ZIP family zinc transporter
MLILTGFLASLAAGLATGLGALPLLGKSRPSDRQENAFLGFAAGVMLAASFFSLIIPGIAHAEESGIAKPWAAAIVIGAMLIGSIFIGQLNRIARSSTISASGPSKAWTKRTIDAFGSS